MLKAKALRQMLSSRPTGSERILWNFARRESDIERKSKWLPLLGAGDMAGEPGFEPDRPPALLPDAARSFKAASASAALSSSCLAFACSTGGLFQCLLSLKGECGYKVFHCSSLSHFTVQPPFFAVVILHPLFSGLPFWSMTPVPCMQHTIGYTAG